MIRGPLLIAIIVWALVPLAGSAHPSELAAASAADSTLPKFGELVYADQLPEAVRKVDPLYTELAVDAGVDGTVIIECLIGRDGLVKNTKVIKSIPMLDEVAEAAARQWVFKPAMANGKPVAVWTPIPIVFSLASFERQQSEDRPLSDQLADLRRYGPRSDPAYNAILREAIIRSFLRNKLRLRLPAAAREHFERGMRLRAERAPAESAYAEFAAALVEAPWWAEPYREVATVEEMLHHAYSAAICLELYLVAAPEAPDWRAVRKRIRHMRWNSESHD